MQCILPAGVEGLESWNRIIEETFQETGTFIRALDPVTHGVYIHPCAHGGKQYNIPGMQFVFFHLASPYHIK
jgi:hypothetical protein